MKYKNIVFSEYYYYVSLVFVVGLYINFATNLLQNCDKFNFIVFLAAMVVGLLTSIISRISIIIALKIKDAKYYTDFFLAFNDDNKGINYMLIANFIMFILCGLLMILINSSYLGSDNNSANFCFICLFFIIFNSLIFLMPLFLIRKIHNNDKKFAKIHFIKVDTEDINIEDINTEDIKL